MTKDDISTNISHENEYPELIEIFKNKSAKAVIYSEHERVSKDFLSRFKSESKASFSKILYAKYDRDKYLYNTDMKCLGLDTVLKKCLSRSFIQKEIDFDSIKCNYFSEFEAALDENTLLIIDNFDVAAPTPYMRHLLAHECPLLIISRCRMNSLPKEIPVIKLTDAVYDNTQVESNINSLSERQTELLMTLCGMLYYLENSTDIESSKSGVFDKSSVEFYLGDLANELSALKDKNLINISPRGEIKVPSEISSYVLSVLKPSMQNCKTFMKFINKLCGFTIMQNYKDTYAKLVTKENLYSSFVSSIELANVYTYFCHSDKNCTKHIYNILSSMMLDRNSMHKGTFNCRHLLWNNRCYFLSIAAGFLRNKNESEYIYSDELYFDEPPSYIYSHSIKAELDIIRFCVTLLRNTTSDLYKESEYIFAILLSAMKTILEIVTDKEYDDEDKAEVLDNVIRLCSETFGYTRVFDVDGSYYHFRDDMQNSRVFYTCERECDTLYASSVLMGYSPLTLTLYRVFQDYISLYLLLSNNIYDNEETQLLVQYNRESIEFYRQISSDISVNLKRITCGFDIYFDFYAEKDTESKIYEKTDEQSLEKILSDNKRYLSRGFDGGTKTGAGKYSDMIMETVKKCDEPLRVILPIFDTSFPLCDYTYKALLDKNFIKLICNSESIPNLTKQIILESLVYSYSEYEGKPEKVSLQRLLICHLDECISHNSSSSQRLYHAAASAFLRHRLHELSNVKSIRLMTLSDFSKNLYERHCLGNESSETFADDYIADILYRIAENTNIHINNKKLLKALKVWIYENGCVFPDGLAVIAKELLSERDCIEVLSLINK